MSEFDPTDQPTGAAPTDDKQLTTATLTHLAGPLCMLCCCPLLGPVVPLIIWMMQKGKDKPIVEAQAKEALNFQLTMLAVSLVAAVAGGILAGLLVAVGVISEYLPLMITIGFPGFLVGLTNLVLAIMAAMKVKSGQEHRYPFCVRLIK